MSRPEKPINWKLVDQLLEANCHGTEIAAHFDMHPDTFYRKVQEQYGVGFTEYSLEKKQRGDSLLRYTQYLKAVGLSDKGDNTMLVWLGKNRLKQAETPVEVSIDTNTMKQFGDVMAQLNAFQERKIEERRSNTDTKS